MSFSNTGRSADSPAWYTVRAAQYDADGARIVGSLAAFDALVLDTERRIEIDPAEFPVEPETAHRVAVVARPGLPCLLLRFTWRGPACVLQSVGTCDEKPA